jgi:hypothetical protein
MKTRVAVLLAVVPLVMAADKPDWVKLAPQGEKFSILLPKEPRDLSPKGGPDSPIRSKVYLYSDGVAGGVAYTVNVTEMPGKITPEDVRDGLVSGGKDKVESDKPFEGGGAKGREFVIISKRTPDRFSRVRVCVVKATIYQLMVAGPEAAVKGKDADKFLASFELTDAANK